MAAPRRYSTALRAEQTALTRRRVIDAAGHLFVTLGYRGTTLGAVADVAGVSVQTVYNVVGGKAALLKAVYDAAFTDGGDTPVPVDEHPAFRAVVAAPTGRACLAAYAGFGRQLGERQLPLAKVVIASAAAGDADMTEFVAGVEGKRRAGSRLVATHVAQRFGLRDGLDVDGAADVLWALTTPDLADRLVLHRGWDWNRFEQWTGTTMADALLGPAG